MADTPTLDSILSYSGNTGCIKWQGRVVNDDGNFESYIRDIVHDRISDVESSFAAHTRSVATTGLESKFIEKHLEDLQVSEGWEIGEAFAECALRDDSDLQVVWPWNPRRDCRTPRASLPGADLVGFSCRSDDVVLLFGEVKTSSDRKSPPSVMSEKYGMPKQLHKIATDGEIQFTLLNWLHSRCLTNPNLDLYNKAKRRFVASEGKDLLIVGVLVRDTSPNEPDLNSGIKLLSSNLMSPTSVELVAWYLPVPIVDWPNLLQGKAP